MAKRSNGGMNMSEMTQHDTGVQCSACKEGNIIADFGFLALKDMDYSGSLKNAGEVQTFIMYHCGECQVMYNFPRGKENFKEDLITQLIESGK